MAAKAKPADSNDFIAFVTLKKGVPPIKVNYSAGRMPEPISKLCEIMRISKLDELYEYEILMVLDGNKYQPIARREQHGKAAPAASSTPATPALPPPAPPIYSTLGSVIKQPKTFTHL